MLAESNLPSSPAVFYSFEPYSADEIGKIISATPSKSCLLDPLVVREKTTSAVLTPNDPGKG